MATIRLARGRERHSEELCSRTGWGLPPNHDFLPTDLAGHEVKNPTPLYSPEKEEPALRRTNAFGS